MGHLGSLPCSRGTVAKGSLPAGAVAERRTRSDRNRQLRRIAAEREAAARREQKRHRRDLENLDQIKAAVLQREADL